MGRRCAPGRWGLGSLSKVPLKAARAKAGEIREQIGDGPGNPASRRSRPRRPSRPSAASSPTRCLPKVIKAKSAKHYTTLQRSVGEPRAVRERVKGRWTDGKPRPAYADRLRAMRVDKITADDVLAVLRPLWATRHETAVRLRAHIAQVLDAAKAARHRSGENPAAWTGNLKHRLAARRKLTRGHHGADALPGFAQLHGRLARSGRPPSADKLEFLIPTWARAGEGARARPGAGKSTSTRPSGRSPQRE